MLEIFREKINFDEVKYKKCYLIFNEKDLYKLRLKAKIKKLRIILNNEDCINYLFHILNKYIKKNENDFFGINKINFLLKRLQLQDILNIEERNNLFQYENIILSKYRLIKSLSINFENNKIIYAEFKSYWTQISTKTRINIFYNTTIFFNKNTLIIQVNNLYKTFYWNELKEFKIEDNGFTCIFSEIKLIVRFNLKSDTLFINRLIFEGYLKWQTS